MVDAYLTSVEALQQQGCTASCDVSIWEGAEAVERTASAWRLLQESAGTTSFQTLSVARAAAHAHAANGEHPRIIVVRENGWPVVVFPTAIGRFAGLAAIRFLGDPFIQYGGALVSPKATAAHLSAAWSAVADPRSARIGIFRKVRSDNPIAPLLAERSSVIASEQSPFVGVACSEKLHARYARETRRLRRRLAEHGALAFEIQHGPAAIEILRETLALKRAWLVERGLPSTVLGNRRWEEVLLALAATDTDLPRLSAARLTIDGKTAATEIGLTDGKTWYAYVAALVPALAKHGPGRVLMDEIVAWCAKTDRTVYDMLPPSQPYKHALATGSVPVRDYAVAFGLLGHTAILAAQTMPLLKRAINAFPLGLRQKIVKLYLSSVAK